MGIGPGQDEEMHGRPVRVAESRADHAQAGDTGRQGRRLGLMVEVRVEHGGGQAYDVPGAAGDEEGDAVAPLVECRPLVLGRTQQPLLCGFAAGTIGAVQHVQRRTDHHLFVRHC
jgi:predicted metallo-beta-lactamase superfamily hydrolase